MRRSLVCWFARQVKTVGQDAGLPASLKKISLIQKDVEARQNDGIVPSAGQVRQTSSVVRSQPVAIAPTHPLDGKTAPPLKIGHPQQYFVKTKLFTNREAKQLMENNAITAKNPYDPLPTQALPQTKLVLRADSDTKNILVQRHKLYLFYKPKGLICTEKDPTGKNRNTVFWYIKNYHNFDKKIYLCVG